jgi:hypothetical protein
MAGGWRLREREDETCCAEKLFLSDENVKSIVVA